VRKRPEKLSTLDSDETEPGFIGPESFNNSSVFGVGYYCTVSRTIGRLNEVLALGGEVPEHFNRISKDLTP